MKRLKQRGADAIKFLLYYDFDEDEKINNYKHVYMERIGSECVAEDIPFFWRLLLMMLKMMMQKVKRTQNKTTQSD